MPRDRGRRPVAPIGSGKYTGPDFASADFLSPPPAAIVLLTPCGTCHGYCVTPGEPVQQTKPTIPFGEKSTILRRYNAMKSYHTPPGVCVKLRLRHYAKSLFP